MNQNLFGILKQNFPIKVEFTVPLPTISEKKYVLCIPVQFLSQIFNYCTKSTCICPKLMVFQLRQQFTAHNKIRKNRLSTRLMNPCYHRCLKHFVTLMVHYTTRQIFASNMIRFPPQTTFKSKNALLQHSKLKSTSLLTKAQRPSSSRHLPNSSPAISQHLPLRANHFILARNKRKKYI